MFGKKEPHSSGGSELWGKKILFQEVLKKVASDSPATENLQLISRSLPRPPFDGL